MHLLLGNKHVENSNYDGAIQSFKNARIKLGYRTRQPLLIVSLVSQILSPCVEIDPEFLQITGWNFDGLAITIQQRLCEALIAAGRAKEAGESILRMVDQQINTTEPIKTWVSGEPIFHSLATLT